VVDRELHLLQRFKRRAHKHLGLVVPLFDQHLDVTLLGTRGPPPFLARGGATAGGARRRHRRHERGHSSEDRLIER